MTSALAFIAAAILQAAAAAPPPAPSVRSIDKGAMSQISTARQVTAGDLDAWTTLWRAHAPARPLPNVDFTRETVVAVFMGTRMTAGFAVEIVGSREEGGNVVVMYKETAPPRDAITAQVLVSPYHLVALPKRPGTITFQKM